MRDKVIEENKYIGGIIVSMYKLFCIFFLTLIIKKKKNEKWKSRRNKSDIYV